MQEMTGLNRNEAVAFLCRRLDARRFAALPVRALCAALLEAFVDFLHACGALDARGDTGEGEYDEDDALEFILDALLYAFPTDAAGEFAYCQLIDACLPLIDDYLFSVGLMSR